MLTNKIFNASALAVPPLLAKAIAEVIINNEK